MEKGEDRDKQGFERERERGGGWRGGDRERGWRRERRRKGGGSNTGKSLEKVWKNEGGMASEN